MTIGVGKKITAADYNELVNATNKVFADNYPDSSPPANATAKANQQFGWGNDAATFAYAGKKITATLVNEVVDRLNLSADHVGSIYNLDRVIVGQKVTANIWQDIQTVATDVNNKKNIAAAGQTAISVLGNIARTGGFGSLLNYTVNLQFADYDRARYFFNSAGSIRLNLLRTGGTSVDSQWDPVYQKLGTVSVSLTNTTSTSANIISEGKGFRDLTATDQLLLTANHDSGYGYGGYGYGGYGYGGYGYGYGYGYGNCGGYGYGYGGYGYGGYGYGGYGYGGYGYGCVSTRNIKVFGRVISTGPTYVIGPVRVILTVRLTSTNPATTSGTHSLYVESRKATSKTNNSASFSIAAPVYSGSSST